MSVSFVPYNPGTLGATNGSKNFTGVGTNYTVLDQFDEIWVDGYPVLVDTVSDDTHFVGKFNFLGTTGTGKSYAWKPTPDVSRAMSLDTLITASIQTGNLGSLAGLTLAADKGLYATGAGTLATFDLKSGARASLGLTAAADQMVYFTGVNTATMTSLTAAARSLLNDADVKTMRATLAATGNLFKLTVKTSSGTHTFDTDTKLAFIECVGGGNTGGAGSVASTSDASAGAGGGAGGYVAKLIDTTSISSGTVTIGAATGGTTSWSDGTNTLTAGGGAAGAAGTDTAVVGAAQGGSGGTASGGTINIPGESGESGLSTGSTINAIMVMEAGGGASGLYGNGGGSLVLRGNTSGGANGSSAAGFGAGGGGGVRYGFVATNAGGAGSAGVCIIWEFK